MNIVILVTTIVMMAGGAVPGISPRVAAPPESPAPLIHALPVEPIYAGGEIVQPGAVVETMDAERIRYIMDTLERLKVEEEAATDRARKVWQIDDYLNGSPMAGLGSTIVANAERTGVNPFLCPAIATAESSNGVALCGSYNAWGMLGCSFSSWEHGVQRFFDNIVSHWGQAQSAYDLNGYCIPDQPWQGNVERVAQAIQRREGFGGGGSSAE